MGDRRGEAKGEGLHGAVVLPHKTVTTVLHPSSICFAQRPVFSFLVVGMSWLGTEHKRDANRTIHGGVKEMAD
jgi:hypothetical protein